MMMMMMMMKMMMMMMKTLFVQLLPILQWIRMELSERCDLKKTHFEDNKKRNISGVLELSVAENIVSIKR